MPPRRSNPPVLKRFGQHFLHDRSVLEAIARARLQMGPPTSAQLLAVGGKRLPPPQARPAAKVRAAEPALAQAGRPSRAARNP